MKSLMAGVALTTIVALPSAVQGSPILLAIDKHKLPKADLYQLTSVRDGVRFDLDGDGIPEQTAWTSPRADVGFLALDRNGNGQIDNGMELIGCDAPPGRRNGFAALAQLARLPGRDVAWVDDQNPMYEKLLIWVDRNHDGKSEPSELVKFSAYYTRIMFGSVLEEAVDPNGNRFVLRGYAELRTAPGANRPKSNTEHDNRLVQIYDVVFAREG